MKQSIRADVVESVIRDRMTEKVTCDVEMHAVVPPRIANRNQDIIRRSVRTAGWAPFHFARNVDKIAEPWRAHILWHNDVKKIALYMRDELKLTNKLPRLAAACNALVIVTWLPQFYDAQSQSSSDKQRTKQIEIDEEHLSAASAMVQNLLLLLTAHGLGTYWSSGGQLRDAEMFEYLGIPAQERLLAAVFIEYPEMMDDSKERKMGSLRNSRSEHWIREVSL